MEVEVNDVFSLNEGLNTLSEKELPVGVAFNIQRINRVVGDELKTAEEMRVKLINKYKDKDLDNGQVKLKENKLGEFNKELDELLKQKVKIDVKKINIKELESISVTPKTLGLLNTILEDAN